MNVLELTIQHIGMYVLSAGDGITESAVNEISGFKKVVWGWFTNVEMWTNFASSLLRIIAILVLSRIAIKIINKIIERSLTNDGKHKNRMTANPRRLKTIGELSKNVVASVFNFVMIMLVLNEFGFNIAPLLASAGVAGLAISFGAQSIVKDIITGFFIIFEDQFAVGDVIQTGTYKGTVQMVGLRTTRLASWNGEVNIIPNGSIINVTNFSLSNSLAVVDIPMSMERSLEDARALLSRATAQLQHSQQEVIDMPEILGVQTLTTGEYSLRIIVKCEPNSRADIERVVQTAIKTELDREKEQQRLLEQQQVADTEGIMRTEANETRDPNISNDQ